MVKMRDEWTLKDDACYREGAQRFTNRLDVAQDAEDFSKAEKLHSYPEARTVLRSCFFSASLSSRLAMQHPYRLMIKQMRGQVQAKGGEPLERGLRLHDELRHGDHEPFCGD